ncbi:MAG: hypothetical protein OEY20_09295 [Gemmatimonadota bacterium]|nr:hypothetical protein [Gemmatimonadota bacterium]MDH5197435.1 hypothetical protein [Gemmatimonadota bacterium]MDH5223058.1 hypothetical protein [Betaproteobacteria bacterium]
MKANLPSLLGAALISSTSLAAAPDIDVMTQNQFIGADLAPVLVAAAADPFDPAAFNAAVVEALGKIAAGRPAQRAKVLAAEIKKRNPDVVGLQELYKLECQPHPLFPAVPGMGCEDPSIRDALLAITPDCAPMREASGAEMGAMPRAVSDRLSYSFTPKASSASCTRLPSGTVSRRFRNRRTPFRSAPADASYKRACGRQEPWWPVAFVRS